MSNKVYVGDIGLKIIVDCGEDITGATTTSLKVQKPDGTTTSWSPANIYNSNYLRYTVTLNDFDQDGRYLIQASLTLAGWTGLGETDIFTVSPVYE